MLGPQGMLGIFLDKGLSASPVDRAATTVCHTHTPTLKLQGLGVLGI